MTVVCEKCKKLFELSITEVVLSIALNEKEICEECKKEIKDK